MSHQEYYRTKYWETNDGWSPAEVAQVDPRLEKLFKEYIQITDHLLDVGCGDGGHYGCLVRSLVTQHYGIDPSLAALSRARECGIAASQASADRALPFASGSIDAAICIEVLEHLFDPAALIQEIWRVLKPDGRLIASVPNIAHFSHRLRLLGGKFVAGGCPPMADRPWMDPHIRFFTRRSFSNMLQAMGFQLVAVIGMNAGALTDFPILSAILRRLLGNQRLRRASNALEGLAHLSPTLFAGHLVAVCRKPATSR